MVLLLWVGTLPFAAFGIPVGYLLDPDTAQPVTVVVTIALAPLGGLWQPTANMTEAMRQIAHLLPSDHKPTSAGGPWPGSRRSPATGSSCSPTRPCSPAWPPGATAGPRRGPDARLVGTFLYVMQRTPADPPPPQAGPGRASRLSERGREALRTAEEKGWL